MKIVLIVIAIIVALLVGLVIFSRHRLKNLPDVAPHKDIMILNERNFKSRVRGRLVLVDFWADWCAPCKMVAPILNEVAAESKGEFTVAKVDVDSNQALAQQFKVRNIPTMLILRNGKEVDRIVGVKTKGHLLKEMRKHQ